MEPSGEAYVEAEVHRVETQPHKEKPKRAPPRTKTYTPTTKAKILESETWALRMGGCSEDQLRDLPQHAMGVPATMEFHPFRFIDFKEQARIRRQPAGRDPMKVTDRAQRLYMDFGFTRASAEDYSRPNKTTDRVVESFDGYSSYLLVVDEKTKHSWIFLTKSKHPPVGLVSLFLQQFGHEKGGVIRVDQGGELGKSSEFISTMLTDHQYVVEPTGADSPSQNGQVEQYNKTVAIIGRTLLYGAALPAKYWSVAVVHAVYLLNRRVHSALKKTPYEAWWDFKPDLSAVRLFGSRVCVKVTGKRRAKLDRHDFRGIFVGYTATDDNIRYIDEDTGQVKTSHHAVFDEAWYLQPTRPPAPQLLYDMGMEGSEDAIRAPPYQPRSTAHYPSIPMEPLKPVPGKAKNIPLPFRNSATPVSTSPNIVTPAAAKLSQCYEGAIRAMNQVSRVNIRDDMDLDKREVFDQFYLSPCLYHETFEESVNISNWTTAEHPTAGIQLIQSGSRVFVAGMQQSTPAAKIPRWRSRIRGAWLRTVAGHEVQSVQDVQKAFEMCKQGGHKQCILQLAHSELKDGITNLGIPQVNIDQLNPQFFLNVEAITHQSTPIVTNGGVHNYRFSKLTRGKLLKQPDWDEWQQSEWLQLDQYASQLMFGEPVYVKDRSNVFHLVWTYNIKDLDKRKKARCACDGSSRGGKARVLDHTYANCVDHTASRLFYGISAAENLLIFGADVCNAFSEAPPPKQGFYIQPDRAFREWWEAKGRGTIPDGCVIPVMRAMQGHPESPRLWEKWCDKMVKELGFTPTTHEPCMYTGYIRGQKCYFKRQVDDFEIAVPNVECANDFFDAIDDFLTMPIKRMGLVTLFNGVDVLQSRDYVKVSAQTYIEKALSKYVALWGKEFLHTADRPLPIPTNETFLKTFASTYGDPDPEVQKALKEKFGFGYRNGIGELIYAMVTCRPDISTAVVRCAQNSAKPAEIHYHAVKHALKYLWTTRKDGIYFWRVTPRNDLPYHPPPDNNFSIHGRLPQGTRRPMSTPLNPYGFVDSDWATCVKTRRSLTGIIIKLAGGTIAYKTKLQLTAALSLTEAEYMAACDAGRMILFIRSILWDLGIPQEAATVLYEDNDACTAMANAQKLTTRTRHMDIKYFALSEWVERDLMVLERIHTSVNEADHMTKCLDRNLFYRHVDYILGHIPPSYSPSYETVMGQPAVNDVGDLNEALGGLTISPSAAAVAKCRLGSYLWVRLIQVDAQVQSNLGTLDCGGIDTVDTPTRSLITIL